MDKFKELNAGNDAVDMMNAFAPNGAVQISGFSTATATIIKGADQIGYFRSGTLRGKEWTKKSLNGANAATLYCTSCGTWIGFHGPGNLLETNSLGLTNWQRVEGKNGAQTILFWTSFEDVTGVKIPDGVKKAPLSMGCCSLLKFVCIGICCDDFCKCCALCHCVLCCRRVKEPLLQPPPAGAKMQRDVNIEYIGDQDGATEKYLTWEGITRS
mmetsp:Transcript_11412/g.22698  ORF Transcript_11412/g.22698 Transcript_11412/m.22698 type:complete len:213 (-) Transcript_11412:169-807(-)